METSSERIPELLYMEPIFSFEICMPEWIHRLIVDTGLAMAFKLTFSLEQYRYLSGKSIVSLETNASLIWRHVKFRWKKIDQPVAGHRLHYSTKNTWIILAIHPFLQTWMNNNNKNLYAPLKFPGRPSQVVYPAIELVKWTRQILMSRVMTVPL